MNDNSLTNYQKMLLRNAYKPFEDEEESVDDLENVKGLSEEQLEAYKVMSQEIESKPLPMFSKKRKDFKPEDFYDAEGNEVEKPVESLEETSEDATRERLEKELKGVCLSCRYFYVSWDHKLPKGCKFYDIKTDTMPSELVHKSLGHDCKHYFNKFSKKFDSMFNDITGISNNEEQD